MAQGASVEALPVTGDPHRRRYVRLASIDHQRVFVPFVHENCPHNQYRALRNRVLAETPTPTAKGLSAIATVRAEMERLLPHVPADDWYVFPQYYSGMKRQKYERATDSVLSRGGAVASDAGVTLFVKCEKLSPEKNPDPDPRAIQFRNPRFCADIARFLKPMEHRLYEFCGDGKVFPPSRCIGKGLNSVERAKLLVGKAARFKNPRFIGLDISRFDMHQHLLLLLQEHAVYKHMNKDPHFARLLHMQLVNRGRSEWYRYKVQGKRMSGDMNTALGNCILMLLYVAAFCHVELKLDLWDILDDGDDAILIVEECEVERLLARVTSFFEELGQKVKVESVADNLDEVEWCQSHPIEVSRGCRKFVRNPFKVMSAALVGTSFRTSQRRRAALVHTIGQAELVLNMGVPVLQEYALALIRNARTEETVQLSESDGATSAVYHRVRRELKLFGLRSLKRLEPSPIQPCARESFTRAWGVSYDDQIVIERALQAWNFSLSGDRYVGQDRDPVTWVRDISQPELYPLRDDSKLWVSS